MNLDKPKGIVAQIAIYTDAITKLREIGFTWEQIAGLVAIIDTDLGKRIEKNTVIRAYYLRAKKKIACGSLIVEQESLTKGKRGPKPKDKSLETAAVTTMTNEKQSLQAQAKDESKTVVAEPANTVESEKSVETQEGNKPPVQIIAPWQAGIGTSGAPDSLSLIERLRLGRTLKVQPAVNNPEEQDHDSKSKKGNSVFIDLDK